MDSPVFRGCPPVLLDTPAERVYHISMEPQHTTVYRKTFTVSLSIAELVQLEAAIGNRRALLAEWNTQGFNHETSLHDLDSAATKIRTGWDNTRLCIYCDEPLTDGEAWYHFNNVCDRANAEDHAWDAAMEANADAARDEEE